MRTLIFWGLFLLMLGVTAAIVTPRRQAALHDLFFSGGDCSSEAARREANALAERIAREEAQ